MNLDELIETQIETVINEIPTRMAGVDSQILDATLNQMLGNLTPLLMGSDGHGFTSHHGVPFTKNIMAVGIIDTTSKINDQYTCGVLTASNRPITDDELNELEKSIQSVAPSQDIGDVMKHALMLCLETAIKIMTRTSELTVQQQERVQSYLISLTLYQLCHIHSEFKATWNKSLDSNEVVMPILFNGNLGIVMPLDLGYYMADDFYDYLHEGETA